MTVSVNTALDVNSIAAGSIGSSSITDGSVALADLANLAQDRIIGRATASTGVPEAITCTATGRSILDDASTAAVLTTIGAAPLTLVGTPCELCVAVSDETTAITTGDAKITFRMPFAMTLTAVRASVNTVSSSGLPTFDINESGSTIFSTKLTIDANAKTSVGAATAAVISDSALADDAEITIDIDVAGTGAKGAKVWLIGTRA